MSSTQQLLLGEGAGGAAPVYIEDVFSTWLYNGTGASQTITNGIDLSTKGGLVWIKSREAYSHRIFDTVRGVGATISSNSTGAQFTDTTMLSAFNTTGFSLGFDSSGGVNDSGYTFASWTFREQPKFFDIVTYSGSSSDQTISHNLGSAPGCIMIKKLDSNTFNAGWAVYHRSLSNPNNNYLVLNTTADTANYGAPYISSVSSTTFTVAGGAGSISIAGSTYVAYLFAHDAGGFGLTGTDNVISCGSYTGNGSATGPEVTIGYEPQWLLIKQTSSSGNSWSLYDNMRGLSVASPSGHLRPNDTDAEDTTTIDMRPTATGFQPINSTGRVNGSGSDYIYIAIRRGPMKVPTVGTTVFIPIAATNASGTVNTTNFPVDMQILTSPSGDNRSVVDRLRGVSTTSTAVALALKTEDTASENVSNLRSLAWSSDSFQTIAYFNNYSALYWNFRRAPGFFDEVCYKGAYSASVDQVVTHNLTVSPELLILKRRSSAGSWGVISTALGLGSYLLLEATQAADTFPFISAVSSSTFSINKIADNYSETGSTYVAYLFATCAGVSKVGIYTGNGSTQTINCGFTGGARFVFIKRTDATGGWYTYDTARGMTIVTDPYLFLNTQGAQTATLGSVTTVSTGFAVDAAVLAAINTSSASYIFLAIA